MLWVFSENLSNEKYEACNNKYWKYLSVLYLQIRAKFEVF